VPSTDAHGIRRSEAKPTAAEAIQPVARGVDPADFDAMLAIAGGLVTACLWASTLLGSARASRLVGSWSTLGWVMLVGLVVALPAVLLTAPHVDLTGSDIGYLVAAGLSNSAGLLLTYTALRRGKVAVVGPIVSTEGAIGAVLAILAGDPVGAATMVVLAIVAVGVVLAAIERPDPDAPPPDPADGPRVSAIATAAIALGGALLFGVNLFATSRLAGEVPLAWTILPARIAGVVGVTLPLIAMRRLTIVRRAVPFVVWVGLAEVAGTATYAVASTDSAPVASVISSQFAAIAAIVAFVFFRERLTRLQTAGAVTIVIGVTLLAIVQAG
jgi:drug/metabolite transporter (DMT)-like permease